MLKILIGVLFIYLNPSFSICESNLPSLLMNFIGVNLIFLGANPLFNHRKVFKFSLIFLAIYYIISIFNVFTYILKLEHMKTISLVLTLLLIISPFILVSFVLYLFEDVDVYLKISRLLNITNAIIVIFYLIIIYISIVMLKNSSIFILLLYMAKIHFLLNFYRLFIYYSP